MLLTYLLTYCSSVHVKTMAFPDFPFREDLPSFMGHEEVLSYLVSYAQHFDLLPFIKAGIVPFLCAFVSYYIWESNMSLFMCNTAALENKNTNSRILMQNNKIKYKKVSKR